MPVTNICGKENCRIYDEKLGLDGTLSELIDWAYRYDKDYSDEALMEIARLAKEYGLPEEKWRIPELVVKDRARKKADDGTLPYEEIKLDKLVYGKISFSKTMSYGEVEIDEDMGRVRLSVTGYDDTGHFITANAHTISEFMQGDDGFLERSVGMALYYGKFYWDEEDKS